MRGRAWWLLAPALALLAVAFAAPVGVMVPTSFRPYTPLVGIGRGFTISHYAKLVGDIKTARIVIEDGAFFKGNIDIVRAVEARPVAAPPRSQTAGPQPVAAAPTPAPTPVPAASATSASAQTSMAAGAGELKR